MKRLFLPCILLLTVMVSACVTSGSLSDLAFDQGYSAHKQGNYKEAAQKFAEAAQMGNVTAQHNIGGMYFNGVGVKKDGNKAFNWFLLAASQGMAGSQHAVGVAYWKGFGTRRDLHEAYKWMGLAEQQNYALAIRDRSLIGNEITKKGGTPSNFDAVMLGLEFSIRRGKVEAPVQYITQLLQDVSSFNNTPSPSPLVARPATTSLPSTPKPIIPSAQAKDTTAPSINIASSITVQSDSPTIKGRVSDNNRVSQVTVEGIAVDLKPDGSFSFSRYVPPSGTNVKIEAVDEWGNKAQKVVRLSRKAVQTAALSFAPLNPTTINGRRNTNAIALVIGVAHYSRAPEAVFADNDANVFGDYAHRALGILRSNIKVLVNDKASLTDLKVSVKRWLRGRIEEGKTDVYVFFAGHGLASPDGKDLYLLPYDGAPSLLEETALLRRELFEVIGKAKPKSATLFLDTCYSGLSRGKETLLASARPVFIRAKEQSVPEGFTVLSAASGQQISSGLDEAKHGLFSYYLMKGMEGPADGNKDRKITTGELHAYLSKNVQKQAIRLGREQTPELSGDGDRVLVRW